MFREAVQIMYLNGEKILQKLDSNERETERYKTIKMLQEKRNEQRKREARLSMFNNNFREVKK